MKTGEVYTEEELEAKGFKYIMHLSGGVHAWENETHWIVYDRASGTIMMIREKPKFTYP